MRYPVRCCCTPGRIIGWLEAPPSVLVVNVIACASGGDEPRRHVLPVRHYCAPFGMAERALSTADLAEPHWHDVVGFIPNDEQPPEDIAPCGTTPHTNSRP